MILKVQPARTTPGDRSPVLWGTVRLPASKSYSIRALIISACGGSSTVIDPSDCDDAQVALSVARHLGAKIFPSTPIKVAKNSKNIYTIAANGVPAQLAKINVRESGTVLRLLLPLLSLRGEKALVAGEGTLKGRPNRHLLNALRQQDVNIHGSGPKESVPIRLTGGTLKGGTIKIDGSLSSQFISSLLIACPQLAENSTIQITGKELVSTDYIAMTIAVLAKAGVKIKKTSPRHYKTAGEQKFKGLKDFTVPSDYGLAAFLLAAAALLPSDIILKGYFDDRFIQADGKILPFLKKMGVSWTCTKDAMRIKGPFSLKGGTFSLKDCPDLVPIMAVLGLFSRGVTKLTHIGHARAKESDRISDLRIELQKVGAQVEETQDTLTIYPLSGFHRDTLLNPQHDHRLAMAFTVLGLKTGLKVRDIECVKKSYPQFVRDLQSLHAPVKVF